MKRLIYPLLFIYIFMSMSSNNTLYAFNQSIQTINDNGDDYCRYKIYSNPEYRIILRYPKEWKIKNCISDSSNMVMGYSGDDGYFFINGISSDKELDEILKEEAFNKQNLYGNSPKIIKRNINGYNSGFIFPSKDQDLRYNNKAVFVVKYLGKMKFGEGKYSYLLIYSDTNNIEKIVDTIIILK